MKTKEKAPNFYRVDKKWVKEENRTFTEYPGMPEMGLVGGLETWLELAQFYVEDLRWLLSLDHYKFWSHMIYSEKAHEVLVNFLKESPPQYIRKSLSVNEDVKNLFKEMEHYVFLIFLRISTKEESENFFIKNMGEIIYNNYLFSVPIILDICSIYSASNSELVKKMINDVVEIAPYFLDDFQEIIPFFINVLKVVKEKLSPDSPNLIDNAKSNKKGMQDVVLYLYDSVATIQAFFEVYPNVCRCFSKSELISEVANFYSNVLPGIERCLSDKNEQINNSFNICDLVKNIRIDMLQIMKRIFDFVSSDVNEVKSKAEMVDEYLTLMTVVLSEPVFFSDYNLIYSVEFGIECAVGNCENVDMIKLNHVLQAVESLVNSDESNLKEKLEEPKVRLKSLIMEVKGIFPDLEEDFIRRCLNYYDNNTERTITAILENSVPLELTESEKKNDDEIVEFRGKHKNKHSIINEVLDDQEEKKAIKERYYLSQLSYVEENTYEDEYDDTYDENIDALEKDGEEEGGRVFVVRRVLRRLEEKAKEEEEGNDDYDDEDEEDEEDEERKGEVCGVNRNYFVENPAVVRDRMEQARAGRGKRDVKGRGRGQGQSKQVMRNRGLKEAHKSFVGNHSRKRGASRKLSRGMIPS